ncbi:MAG: cyclic pyranopterin monophosphate synthase MoaC [bacterium]|nr:cyclic pyranopterin monophosphate synthase MoaC [bacterium]
MEDIRMVDVTHKEITKRIAIAKGKVRMKKETILLIKEGKIEKGDVLKVSKIAGIMGAKRTFELIPLCHPLNVSWVDVRFRIDEKENCVEIEGEVHTSYKTGVEMEALTAVSLSALSIYDMCKPYDKSIVISDIHLVKKTGGKGQVDRTQIDID